MYLSTPEAITTSYPEPCVVVNVGYVVGLQGANLLVIREEDALVIAISWVRMESTPAQLDELYLSAITEAMNMMMGSAATSMAELFAAIDISPPATSSDFAVDALTDGNLTDEEAVVTIQFRMEIEDLVDSTILQVTRIDFAKRWSKPSRLSRRLRKSEPWRLSVQTGMIFAKALSMPKHPLRCR